MVAKSLSGRGPVANARRGAIGLHCNFQERPKFEGVASGFQMTTVIGDKGPEAGSPNLKGTRILLVEDSWQLGMALKSLLRSFDADVDGPVATTKDAERLISEHVPDAAIIDVNLRQGERSYGLIDQLVGRGVPVVVTSGYSDLPMVSAKAHILAKPISEEKLIAILRTVTNRS
jgi:CheY-like chemotaxis protein